MQSEGAAQTLGDLVSLVRGNTYKSALLSLPGPILLGLASIQRDGGFRGDSLKTYGGESAEKLLLRPGDLYVSLKDVTQSGDLLGAVARVPKSVELGRLTQDTVKLQFDRSRYPLDLLYWTLRCPEYRAYCRERAIGTTNLSLSRDDFLAFPLPSADADRLQLVELLEAIECRIDVLRQTNATLESIAQALFKSWFIDFDPVRAKAEGREPEGMDAATAALFPDELEESTLGLIPKGWTVEPMEDWLTALETGRRPRGGVGNIPCGVPSIGAESITRVGQFDFAKTKYVTEDFFAQMKSGHVQSYDVLLYKDGGKPGTFLPRVSMFGDGFPFEVCGINEHVFRVRVREPLGQIYLYFWLWSDAVMHELRHRGGKAAIPGINQSDVKEQKLLIPNKSVASTFNEKATPLFAKIFNNANLIQSLASMRDQLLSRLISGKLRVPECQEKVQEAIA